MSRAGWISNAKITKKVMCLWAKSAMIVANGRSDCIFEFVVLMSDCKF